MRGNNTWLLWLQAKKRCQSGVERVKQTCTPSVDQYFIYERHPCKPGSQPLAPISSPTSRSPRSANRPSLVMVGIAASTSLSPAGTNGIDSSSITLYIGRTASSRLFLPPDFMYSSDEA